MIKTTQKKSIKISLYLIFLLIIFGVYFVIDYKINAKKKENIILISIDCLREDHLSCYGYSKNTTPNIDNLAQHGIVFKNAYSNAPWTTPSVASLFTSLYPNTHNAINHRYILPEGVLTIAEILKKNEYYTIFFNGGNSNISKKFKFGQGFDTYIQTKRDSAILANKFLSELPKFREKKFFACIHFMDAHLPYNKNKYNSFLSKKNNYFEPGDINNN